MKKTLGVSLFALALLFSACGGNKVDLKDHASVAKHLCEKQKEVIELIKAEKPDEDAIIRISEQMEVFEKDLNQTHGDTIEKFRSKVDTEMNKICPDATLE